MRDELRLAQLEVSGKAKKAGLGVGMFGAAGLLALYGVGVSSPPRSSRSPWRWTPGSRPSSSPSCCSPAAGVAALLGKKRVQEAAPPVPTKAVESLKRDVDAVRHPTTTDGLPTLTTQE